MGKKSREKREGKKRPEKTKAEPATLGALGTGDLRLVPRICEDYIKGIPQAETTLKMMGRDAAGLVSRIGEAKEDARLSELGRKLVAIRPQVETNLFQLRRASVLSHVEKAAETAALATDAEIALDTFAVAIFDPAVVIDDLVKGGKPRNDPNRVRRGDIAWFSAAPFEKVSVKILLGAATESESEEQPVEADPSALELRLRVTSGVAFVGPPEAADGPRLGELRLDPFGTRLDEYLARGRLVRLKPGDYKVAARRSGPDQLSITLTKTVQPLTNLSLDNLLLP